MTFVCVANRYSRVAYDDRQTARQRPEYKVSFVNAKFPYRQDTNH